MNAIPDSIPVVIGHFEAQAEIEDFAKTFLRRFECESEKSFCDSFEDKARAKVVFDTYLEVIEESLAMLGWGGRYPTGQNIRDLIRRQRNFRTELNELVKTARTVENT